MGNRDSGLEHWDPHMRNSDPGLEKWDPRMRNRDPGLENKGSQFGEQESCYGLPGGLALISSQSTSFCIMLNGSYSYTERFR